MKNNKKLGIMMLAISILITLTSLVFTFFAILSIGTYITWYSSTILAAITFLLFSTFMLWVSWRYIKNKPLRKNKRAGISLILLGIIYFLSKLIPVIYYNVTKIDSGGEFQPIIGLIVGLFFILFGIGLIKNEKKTLDNKDNFHPNSKSVL